MFGLLKREKACVGVVRFRGNIPPRAEEFASLAKQGVEVKQAPTPDNAHWQLRLKHPTWGRADVLAPRNPPPFPVAAIDFARELSDDEKLAARAGGTELMVGVEARHKHVLADRKNLLRFLRAIMGDEGVLAYDSACMGCWSRERLDDELQHDADLDVMSVIALHGVLATDDEQPKPKKSRKPRTAEGADEDESEEPRQVAWLHTHGLAELGGFDIDILRPHRSVAGIFGSDLIRAMAFLIAEGGVKPGQTVPLMHPNLITTRLVPVADFHEHASDADAALRDNDESHNNRRVILCEPQAPSWKFWKGSRPRPCEALCKDIPDEGIVHFSDMATDMMSRRARATLPIFASLIQEFAPPACMPIAKIGYDAKGGDTEHLWFTVHSITSKGIDATLDSKPFGDVGMQAGDRRVHDPAQLTEWKLMTPMFVVDPTRLFMIRVLREAKPMLGHIAMMMAAAGADKQ